MAVRRTERVRLHFFCVGRIRVKAQSRAMGNTADT